MRKYSNPADFLSNPQRYSHNFRLLRDTLQYFKVENCLITIAPMKGSSLSTIISLFNSQNLKQHTQVKNIATLTHPKLDLIEPIFSISFAIYQISYHIHYYWTSLSLKNDFFLSSSNEFLPDESHFLNNIADEEALYVLQYKQSLMMWVLPFTVTNIPLMNLKCELRSGRALHSAEWTGK